MMRRALGLETIYLNIEDDKTDPHQKKDLSKQIVGYKG
jgi:hypothetical protein